MSDMHQAVMLEQSCQYLITDKSGVYVDATFGRGGHSRYILSELSSTGKLFSYDKDTQACSYAINNIADARFKIFNSSFSIMCQDLSNYLGKVSGVLFDLGVSSPQLDQAVRGFSYSKLGPLDMRMDLNQEVSAADWLYDASEEDIANVLYNYGEEKRSRRIAAAIVGYQALHGKIATTECLVKIINQAVGHNYQVGKNPAVRTFQALRIVVNSEFSDLTQGLQSAFNLLKVGGRLVVISFHSLEHRLVKQFMQSYLPGNEANTSFMLPQQQPKLKKVAKFSADITEVRNNVRARSAQCRVVEKIAC